MKKLSFIFLSGLLLIIFYTLSLSCRKKEADFTCIAVLTNPEILDSINGKLYSPFKDTSLICYSGDKVLYRESIESTTYNKKAFKNGRLEMTDDPSTIKSIAMEHRFYIHKKNENTGLRYDSIGKKLTANKFDVDSLLSIKNVFRGGEADEDPESSLFSTIKMVDGKIIEKYTYTSKVGSNYPDTVCLTFDSRWKKAVPYTISKKLDSLRKMKLVRVSIIFNPLPKEKSKYHIAYPRRVIDMKIWEAKLNNKDKSEILNIFEKFKKDKT